MRALCLLGLLLLSLTLDLAHATSVSPINIEMTAAGSKSRAHIVVTNTTGEPIAIEPSTAILTLGRDGKSTTRAADADFLILPTQAFIPAGAKQTFRVQWLADPALAESRSYLITMNQLPVQALAGQAGLQLMVSFGVAVNVAPLAGRGDLKVLSSGLAARQPFVVVSNPTSVHALLKDATVIVAGDGWSKTLPPGSLQDNLGTGLLQPHLTRTFKLPVQVPKHVARVTVAVDYQPGK